LATLGADDQNLAEKPVEVVKRSSAESVSMALATVREAHPDDLNFILATWLRSFRNLGGKSVKAVPEAIYYKSQAQLIRVLLKDSRFVSTGSAQAESRLANAVIGEAAGFTVIKSNNVPNTSATKYRIIAGHNMAWTMAMQLAKIEAYRPEKRFADAVKGLQLYGATVVRPQALAVLCANKP
jgi:hypothetical protein